MNGIIKYRVLLIEIWNLQNFCYNIRDNSFKFSYLVYSQNQILYLILENCEGSIYDR